MNTAPEPVEPPITDDLRQAALQRKGGWLYSVDPAYDPDGPVPGHAVVGAWPVDEHGAIGPFTHNPNYRPTAQALGLPAPDNPVTAALQAAATGHGSEHDLLAAVRAHTWIVPAHPDGTPRLHTRPDGSPVLDIYTGHTPTPNDWHSWRTLTATELLAAAPARLDLRIDPGSSLSVTIPAADLH